MYALNRFFPKEKKNRKKQFPKKKLKIVGKTSKSSKKNNFKSFVVYELLLDGHLATLVLKEILSCIHTSNNIDSISSK